MIQRSGKPSCGHSQIPEVEFNRRFIVRFMGDPRIPSSYVGSVDSTRNAVSIAIKTPDAWEFIECSLRFSAHFTGSVPDSLSPSISSRGILFSPTLTSGRQRLCRWSPACLILSRTESEQEKEHGVCMSSGLCTFSQSFQGEFWFRRPKVRLHHGISPPPRLLSHREVPWATNTLGTSLDLNPRCVYCRYPT
jgi:hypothetical protein